MTTIQPISSATSNTQPTSVNGITINDIKAKTSEIAKIDSIDPAAPMRDITFYSSVINTITLDKVLANQKTIINNQNIIMQKLGVGENLDTKA